jgi:hypothetical protein
VQLHPDGTLTEWNLFSFDKEDSWGGLWRLIDGVLRLKIEHWELDVIASRDGLHSGVEDEDENRNAYFRVIHIKTDVDQSQRSMRTIRIPRYAWEHGSEGHIPDTAAVAGREATGEPLYIARARLENGLHIGKVRRGFEGALIPYGAKEIETRAYEVFVGVCYWSQASNGEIPIGAIVAGHEGDGTPLYVARAEYENGVHLGKVRPGFVGANITYAGEEVEINPYEVLVSS